MISFVSSPLVPPLICCVAIALLLRYLHDLGWKRALA